MTDLVLSPDARSAQLLAIKESSWSRHFRVYQPHNFASWVFLIYLVFGTVTTIRYFRPGAEFVGAATLTAFLAFAIYGLPWIWAFRHVDRWTQLPAQLVLFGFLWGAVTATFYIAMPANDALLSIYNKAISATFAQDWGAGLAAPFTEETAKGIGIMLLIFMAPRIIRTPFDGLMLGAFVGLGFQLTEDVLYAVNETLNAFGSNQIGSVIKILALRGVVGLASHALFSAIYGVGLVYLIGTISTPRRLGRGVAIMLLAMVFHGTWDAAAAIAGESGIPALVVMLIAVAIEVTSIIIILRLTSRSERVWMRDLMTPEVERGTITEAELVALSGTRKERKHFIKSVKGRARHTAQQHILDAANDLAEAISKSDGLDTPDVRHARSEVLRVRGMAA